MLQILLQNAYLLAKIGADTAENERNFAENLPKLTNTLRVRELEAVVSGDAARRQEVPGSAPPFFFGPLRGSALLAGGGQRGKLEAPSPRP